MTIMQNVGRLEPGVKYIYERVNGVTYARKLGEPAHTRIEVGKDYDGPQILGMPAPQVARLVDMAKAAEHNPALQDALDRAKVIYELSRQPEDTIAHHPV